MRHLAFILAMCVMLAMPAFAQEELGVRIVDPRNGYEVYYNRQFDVEVEVKAPAYEGHDLRSLEVSASGEIDGKPFSTACYDETGSGWFRRFICWGPTPGRNANFITYRVTANAKWGDPPNEISLQKKTTISLAVTDKLYVTPIEPKPWILTVLYESPSLEVIKVELRYPGSDKTVPYIDREVQATINGEPVTFLRREDYFYAEYDLESLCCGTAGLDMVFFHDDSQTNYKYTFFLDYHTFSWVLAAEREQLLMQAIVVIAIVFIVVCLLGMGLTLKTAYVKALRNRIKYYQSRIVENIERQAMVEALPQGKALSEPKSKEVIEYLEEELSRAKSSLKAARKLEQEEIARSRLLRFLYGFGKQKKP